MIIYIYGEDSFRSREYLKQITDQFKKQRDPDGYNTVFLDGKKEKVGKILSEIGASPFLAERRMIIVENLLTNKDKIFLEEMLNFIKNKKILDSNVLVIWQGEAMSKIKEAKSLHALLSKEKFAQEFKKMTEHEAVAWAQIKIKDYKAKINTEAIGYLCQNANGDTWFLNGLISQLVFYKNGDEIKIEDVKLFLEEKALDNIFNMAEAVASGNKKNAFKLIEDQRRLGQDESYLFSMILRQFKILLKIRDLFEREDNLRSDEMAKILKIHPFVVKKSLPLVKRYSLNKLKDIYKDLLDMDIDVKTGQVKQSLVIDFFIGKN